MEKNQTLQVTDLQKKKQQALDHLKASEIDAVVLKVTCMDGTE